MCAHRRGSRAGRVEGSGDLGGRVVRSGFGVWDASVSLGAHETDLFFIRDTVNASLGYDTRTAFDVGSNRAPL